MSVISEIYPDYKSAAAACGRGYDDPEIAKVIAFKTAHFAAQQETVFLPEQALNTILAVGIAASDGAARPLHVLDFGGGCGFHYFAAKKAFKAALRWAVVETSTMAAQAQEVAKGAFEVYETLEQAAASLGRIDLVHASGALQCVPDPIQTLDALIALRAGHVMLARFPIWHGPLTFQVQASPLSEHGLGPMPPGISDRIVRITSIFPNAGMTLARFKEDYDLVVTLGSPSGSYTLRGQNVPGATLVFRAK